jgi:hypothetical protein
MVGVEVSEGVATGTAEANTSAELAAAIGAAGTIPDGPRPAMASPPTRTAIPIATVAVTARIRRLRR